MRIKLFAVLLLFATAIQNVNSSPVWTWPVAGKQSGSNISYRPQQYIDKEHNTASMFIDCREGEQILSPVDGVITALCICRARALTYNQVYQYDPGKELRPQAERIAAESGQSADSKYLCGVISIRLDDGRTLTISGIDIAPGFKTGQQIHRSDKIGTAGYSYEKIGSPSICINVSDQNHRVSDPMSPFGIPSTFIPPTSIAVRQTFTADQARRDILSITAVLKEAYPSLDDLITAEEFDEFEKQMLDSVAGGISRKKLYRLMQQLQGRIHDSHIYLYPDEEGRADRVPQNNYPQIFSGWIDGECRVTMTTQKYASLLGRRIMRINGESADSIRMRIESRIGGYDGRIESVLEERLAIYSTSVLNDACDVDLVLDDGSRIEAKGIRGFNPSNFTSTYMNYLLENRNHQGNLSLRMIDDSVAYMGISTFQLNNVETDRIISFIDSVADVPAMIIDLRNNGGGDTKVLNRILASILNAPSRAKGDIMQVKQRGNFSSFRDCCLNYPDTIDIFPQYAAKEGADGFYDEMHSDRMPIDTAVNYKGRVYVLTNSSSCSAATIFPAEIVRNRRGVVVGRETGTAYHFMTAYKFADIRLPESGFQWQIPLVKIIYDTTRCERLPDGRGVMPDYPVDLTFDEIYNRPDSILRYALKLIEEGRYISEDDPFAAIDMADDTRHEQSGLSQWLWIAAIIVAAATSTIAIIRRRRK
ncbi:MAG: S41 family peptidase [Alistipes sp.]|nr:S41 family peptidase [Alistipes sp.]